MHPNRLAVAAAMLAMAGGLVGCGPAASRADGAAALDAVAGHLDASTSAVATTRLALQDRTEGRLLPVTADATVGAAAETATSAAHGIATLVVPDMPPEARAARQQALSAASDAVASVAQARDSLGARDPAATRRALATLDDAARSLDQAGVVVEHAASAEAAP
ncbi:hypothetical protein [Xylanimonas sp. McL0601]|uniref:hypothetical protein n=1 Tax=Xylanimonas sp. McL0601 TaxID=3414739 RepID=UPI003CFA8FCA